MLFRVIFAVCMVIIFHTYFHSDAVNSSVAYFTVIAEVITTLLRSVKIF